MDDFYQKVNEYHNLTCMMWVFSPSLIQFRGSPLGNLRPPEVATPPSPMLIEPDGGGGAGPENIFLIAARLSPPDSPDFDNNPVTLMRTHNIYSEVTSEDSKRIG